MKLIHLSDLHLGKRVNEFSMIEDQEFILDKIIRIIAIEQPEGVMISGDIYDKSVPSVEAVNLFDNFIFKVSSMGVLIFAISGNHDSAERISFGARLMDKSGVYLSQIYDGNIECVKLKDEFGNFNIYMLPFVKPAHVKRFYKDTKIDNYTEAIACAIENADIDIESRNILMAHQFVTGASTSESEDINVGGLDNVDSTVFAPFDYVALGHIHKPQNMSGSRIRYCGTPLKYSFSEVNNEKSVTLIDFKEKNNIKIRTIALKPLHEMREIRGRYEELTRRSFYKDMNTDDYYRIILTDEEDIFDAIGKLRTIYPNIMKISYDNKRTQTAGEIVETVVSEHKTPFELFDDFYEKRNGISMNNSQRGYMESLINKTWEDDNETL